MTKDQDYFLNKLQEGGTKVENTVELQLTPMNPEPQALIYFDSGKKVLTFRIEDSKILEFGKNGDVKINGEFVTNNLKIFEEVRYFFETTNNFLRGI